VSSLQVCAALCGMAPRLLVYMSCCEASLERDMVHLLGGPFVVTAARRFDHFPG